MYRSIFALDARIADFTGGVALLSRRSASPAATGGPSSHRLDN